MIGHWPVADGNRCGLGSGDNGGQTKVGLNQRHDAAATLALTNACATPSAVA
jgi:hypothetical protein